MLQKIKTNMMCLFFAVCVGCLSVSCGYMDSSFSDDFGTPLAGSGDAVNADQAVPDKESRDRALAADAKADKIYVYVCGAVKNPGVYQLTAGARQVTAIQSAGGMLPDACADGMNLAAVLCDGERIYVPTKAEVDSSKLCQETSAQMQGQAGKQPEASALVNINTAAKEQLMTLPGIGSSKAQRIIEYRETYGRFSDIEALKNVPGIKSGTYDSLKDLITVG